MCPRGILPPTSVPGLSCCYGTSSKVTVCVSSNGRQACSKAPGYVKGVDDLFTCVWKFSHELTQPPKWCVVSRGESGVMTTKPPCQHISSAPAIAC